MSTLTSVIADKHSVARRLRGATGGLSIRTGEKATVGIGCLEYKRAEFTRTIQECPVWTKLPFADLNKSLYGI